MLIEENTNMTTTIKLNLGKQFPLWEWKRRYWHLSWIYCTVTEGHTSTITSERYMSQSRFIRWRVIACDKLSSLSSNLCLIKYLRCSCSEDCSEYGLKTISDLKKVEGQLKGFTRDFNDREDGNKNLGQCMVSISMWRPWNQPFLIRQFQSRWYSNHGRPIRRCRVNVMICRSWKMTKATLPTLSRGSTNENNTQETSRVGSSSQ